MRTIRTSGSDSILSTTARIIGDRLPVLICSTCKTTAMPLPLPVNWQNTSIRRLIHERLPLDLGYLARLWVVLYDLLHHGRSLQSEKIRKDEERQGRYFRSVLSFCMVPPCRSDSYSSRILAYPYAHRRVSLVERRGEAG